MKLRELIEAINDSGEFIRPKGVKLHTPSKEEVAFHKKNTEKKNKAVEDGRRKIALATKKAADLYNKLSDEEKIAFDAKAAQKRLELLQQGW